ncbi:MAG: DciA family protein [Desulforhopalus sp.]
MSRYRKRQNYSIAELLPSLVHDKGWEKQLDQHALFLEWQERVPEDVAKYAEPLKIEKGVLWVEVENSSWMQQFQYQKLEILDRLNETLRVARLKDLRLVLVKGRDKEPVAKKDFGISFIRPSKEKIAAFEKQVECISDEKCRDALMQFWYLAQACKRKNE